MPAGKPPPRSNTTFHKTSAATNAMLFNQTNEAIRALSTGLVVGSEPDMCCSRGDLKTTTGKGGGGGGKGLTIDAMRSSSLKSRGHLTPATIKETKAADYVLLPSIRPRATG